MLQIEYRQISIYHQSVLEFIPMPIEQPLIVGLTVWDITHSDLYGPRQAIIYQLIDTVALGDKTKTLQLGELDDIHLIAERPNRSSDEITLLLVKTANYGNSTYFDRQNFYRKWGITPQSNNPRHGIMLHGTLEFDYHFGATFNHIPDELLKNHLRTLFMTDDSLSPFIPWSDMELADLTDWKNNGHNPEYLYDIIMLIRQKLAIRYLPKLDHILPKARIHHTQLSN